MRKGIGLLMLVVVAVCGAAIAPPSAPAQPAGFYDGYTDEGMYVSLSIVDFGYGPLVEQLSIYGILLNCPKADDPITGVGFWGFYTPIYGGELKFVFPLDRGQSSQFMIVFEGTQVSWGRFMGEFDFWWASLFWPTAGNAKQPLAQRCADRKVRWAAELTSAIPPPPRAAFPPPGYPGKSLRVTPFGVEIE